MEVIIVGRSNKCDFVYNDPYVSREHLQMVKYSEDKYVIIDIDSSTGTYVNGEKIPTGVEIEVQKSDIIKIGNTLLKWNGFFKKKQQLENQDIYTTIPDKDNPETAQGNEEQTLPPELEQMIDDFASDGIYSEGEKTALMAYCKTNNINYDSQVLPIITEKLAEIHKKRKIPETITVSIKYASFWQRLAALIIDSILYAIITVALFLGVVILSGSFNQEEARILLATIQILVSWFYFAFFESSKTQATPGKQVLRIKITDEFNEKISFGKATGRFFGKTISALILFIGFLMPFWSEKRQTLHDMMAGCYVIEA